jgi:hypothetical protein
MYAKLSYLGQGMLISQCQKWMHSAVLAALTKQESSIQGMLIQNADSLFEWLSMTPMRNEPLIRLLQAFALLMRMQCLTTSSVTCR